MSASLRGRYDGTTSVDPAITGELAEERPFDELGDQAY